MKVKMLAATVISSLLSMSLCYAAPSLQTVADETTNNSQVIPATPTDQSPAPNSENMNNMNNDLNGMNGSNDANTNNANPDNNTDNNVNANQQEGNVDQATGDDY